MKKSIGRMVFIDRNDALFGTDVEFYDFEVHSITSSSSGYEGYKVDGSEFHCFKSYWKYTPYPEPKEVLVVGESYLMNFYDRSGDNWEPVKILFVGKEVFVFERDGKETACLIEGNEFRNLEAK